MRLQGTCEGAADVPKELRLEQGCRHASTVDGDEGRGSTRARIMNYASEQTFARPGLARDEDGRFYRRSASRKVPERARGRARAENAGQGVIGVRHAGCKLEKSAGGTMAEWGGRRPGW